MSDPGPTEFKLPARSYAMIDWLDTVIPAVPFPQSASDWGDVNNTTLLQLAFCSGRRSVVEELRMIRAREIGETDAATPSPGDGGADTLRDPTFSYRVLAEPRLDDGGITAAFRVGNPGR